MDFSTFRRRRSAFTLVELMVVVGIIILLLAIAIPAMGPLTASNQMMEATTKLKSLMVQAQTAAVGNGTPVGIRFERAYETTIKKINNHLGDPEPYEVMATNVAGKPKWLNHQWARLVVFAGNKKMVLDPLSGSKPMDLPAGIWAAPDDAIEWGKGAAFDDSIGWPSGTPSLREADLAWQPPNDPTDANPVAYNRFDTFLIAFGPSGELGRFRQMDNRYYDAMQMYYSSTSTPPGGQAPPPGAIAPVIEHPDGSSRGVLLYNRSDWEGLPPGDAPNPDGVTPRTDFLKRTARPVYINRNLGETLQEKTP